MPQLLTMNVKNYESQTQNFYFFQQPAIYTGGGEVYSNSLFAQSLGNYDNTGAILTFQVNLQYYAGIQQANTPPQIGASSGYSSASRAIDLAPSSGGGGKPNDWTTATVNPLGLSSPIYGEGVQPGAFRVTTPVFNSPPYFNVGSAVAVNGGIVLSNWCCHVKFLWLERSAARGYSGDTGRNFPCIESFEPMVANCLRGAATGRN
ncbi:hypothetical protein [Rhizobium leguminosarum]|uniref:Uncharacterized protein n=4 Tax=Rhizobium TaxID=379 RepID=A0A2Z4YRD3_RHILE|nr:hypothetical protein [Rhizobium leguminosarum]AXA43696.1 hypothetical protein DLJ82_7451 [Rhizobium leguminosarum]UIK20265.1 hypothetical protein LZK79_27025 [Rhizobium leguminosarum]